MADRTLTLTITGDPSRAQKALLDVGSAAGGLGGTLRRVGEVAAGFLTANVVMRGFDAFQGFVGDGIEGAKNLEQSIGAVGQIFGEQANQIHAWAKNAADSVGLSRNSYNELAAFAGTVVQGMGVTGDKTAKMTDDLIRRGADLSAMYGGTAADAVRAMNSALIGNTEAVRGLGISLTALDIQERALTMTGKARASELTQAEKQQATYALLMEKSAIAAGQFANEADTASGAEARQTAAQEDAATMLGEYLLPIQMKVTEAKLAFVRVLAEKVIPALGQLTEWVGERVGPVLGLLGAWVQENVIPALRAFGEMVRDVVVARVLPLLRQLGERVQAEFEKFKIYYESDVKPAIDNIVRAVEWLVGEIAERWPQIEQVIRPVLEQVQATVEFVFDTVKNIIATVLDLIQGDWEGAWNNIKEILTGAVEFIEETLGNILDFIGELAVLLFDAAKDLGGKIVDGIVAGIKALGGAIGNALLDAIPDSVPLPGPLPSIPLPKIPGLATGGVGNGLTWVGEHGPELVNFGSPSRVFSASESRAIARGGVQERGNHYSITVNALDPRGAADAVLEALRRLRDDGSLSGGVLAP